MATNKELVKAFTEARKLIANKRLSAICFALDNASDNRNITRQVCEDAVNIISERLGDSAFVGSWLRDNVPGLTEHYLYYTRDGLSAQREYRLRWLDSLIADFS
jgi:hypothetical protein